MFWNNERIKCKKKNKQPTIENELDNIICNWKCEAFYESLDSQLKNKLKSIEIVQGTYRIKTLIRVELQVSEEENKT